MASSSHREHRHHRSHKRTRSPSPTAELPFSSRPITKYDYDILEPVFASYLSIQKEIDLSTLTHRESHGRFKSFCNHYNRGDLAQGWYERAVKVFRGDAAPAAPAEPPTKKPKPEPKDSESSESDVGPALPGQEKRRRHGPGAPMTQDLELQDELNAEDEALRRADLRFERKLDRKRQKEALEELVPRAEAGTRERQIEKKKEVNAKMREFREKSPGGEVDEATVMGGGDESFAQKKAARARKKNEREMRREQLLKARIAEREERMQAQREKEEKTMAMLKQLASRFQ